MDDFPAAIADMLETYAGKIRNLTVDRVRNWATWAAAGMIVGLLALVLVVFFFVGVFRLLASLVTVEIAYLILGGIFVVIGAFLWSKRVPKSAAGDATLNTLAESARKNNG